jgi:hypothetical protein
VQMWIHSAPSCVARSWQEPRIQTVFLSTTGPTPGSRSDFSGEFVCPELLVEAVGASAIRTGSAVSAARLRLAMGFNMRAAITMAVSMTCELEGLSRTQCSYEGRKKDDSQSRPRR